MTFKPEVIEGGKGKQAQFVCPFCGESFARRHSEDAPFEGRSLDGHWEESPRCGNNRNVNNPTQSKYLDNVDD
jgi:hypothetical protein